MNYATKTSFREATKLTNIWNRTVKWNSLTLATVQFHEDRDQFNNLHTNMPRQTITTNEILEANPDDTFTQREFSKDEGNKTYQLNTRFVTHSNMPVAKFYFDNDTTVALYNQHGELVWRDWYSKFKAWEKNGEFRDMDDPDEISDDLSDLEYAVDISDSDINGESGHLN